MENLDFNSPYFVHKKMVPEETNELTCLWGRKIVGNIASGIGLIGTAYVDKDNPTIVAANLSKSFQFPPFVFLMYYDESNGLCTIREGSSYDQKRIVYGVSPAGLYLQHGPSFQSQTTNVIYKLHCV